MSDSGQEVIPRQPGPPAEPIRVLIADDHELFRRGVENALARESDLLVVGVAADGAQALAAAVDLLPDVALLDVRMPGLSGIEAAAAIKQAAPAVRVVMLTISDAESDLLGAIRAGASGYLLKEVPADELVGGIRAVHQGQSLISPSMASKLLSEFASLVARQPGSDRPPPPTLTERELEVLRLVARGLGNREIAATLFISENTVKNHVRNILEKLQLHSRMEAVFYAVREKLLDLT